MEEERQRGEQRGGEERKTKISKQCLHVQNERKNHKIKNIHEINAMKEFFVE